MIRLFRRSMGPPVRLDTSRFVMDTLTRRELAAVSLPWTDDPAVMDPLEYEAGGWSIRRWERQVLRPNNRDKFAFGIRPREGGAVVGYELAQISRTNVALLTVVIGDKSWWGKGVVIETRTALLRFLFEIMRCERVWGVVYARNLPSVANYLALGFAHEGTLRRHTRLANGERGDALVFGMIRAEWETKQRGPA